MKHNTDQCKDDCEEVKAFSEQLETLLMRDVAHQKAVVNLESKVAALEAKYETAQKLSERRSELIEEADVEIRRLEAEVKRLTAVLSSIHDHRVEVARMTKELAFFTSLEYESPSGDGKGNGTPTDLQRDTGEIPTPETPGGRKHAPISPQDPLEKVER